MTETKGQDPLQEEPEKIRERPDPKKIIAEGQKRMTALFGPETDAVAAKYWQLFRVLQDSEVMYQSYLDEFNKSVQRDHDNAEERIEEVVRDIRELQDMQRLMMQRTLEDKVALGLMSLEDRNRAVEDITRQHEDILSAAKASQRRRSKEPTLKEMAMRKLEFLEAIRKGLQDELTHKLNRTGLTEIEGPKQIGRSIREIQDERKRKSSPEKIKRKSCSFLMLDVDHFKHVNDEHGHLAGDIVLKAIADIIDDEIRESDYLIRYGGEEFCVILPDTNEEEAMKVAENIRRKVETTVIPVNLPTGTFTIQKTVSIGVANIMQIKETFEQILDIIDKRPGAGKKEDLKVLERQLLIEVVGAADAAMYVSKKGTKEKAGRNQVTQFALGMERGTEK